MDEATFNELASKRLVYAVPGMEQVPVRKDITFKQIGELALKMDVYYPREMEPGTTRPAVILVSGGDLPPELLVRGKDIGLYISYGQLIAASGFVAVTFNHRSIEGYTKLHEVGSDIDDLVSYVRENASSLKIDAHALCIWAFSSGALYGLRTAMCGAPPYIRCIVSYYGGMSILNKEYFHYSPEEEPTFQEFSPVYYLRTEPGNIPPLFIAKAGLDQPALNKSIDEFVQEASTRNIPFTFVNHPAGRHGFDIFNDDARSREIIRMTVEFLKEHLI
jgi:acetyl esterase/lipase